jgi:DNA polymerase elongation subunit (family B)
METRDPGTAPKVGDRLQFIYVAENKTRLRNREIVLRKSGMFVETELTPDAQFYITNQIQNPVAQLFALCIEQLDGYVPPRTSELWRRSTRSFYKKYER